MDPIKPVTMRTNHVMIVSALLASGCGSEKATEPLPNIILINIDDMGYKDVGFMGSEFYETPNIDRLAGQGMLFTNGYAAAANCAPSRACLMSGLNTPRHGIYTVGISDRGASAERKLIPTLNTATLDTSFVTLAEALHDAGYTTCHAGKWHLGDSPRDYGFDINIGGSHAGHPASYYYPYGNVNLESPDSVYLTDLVMDHVLGFLDTVDGGPFFLNYWPYAVHSPFHRVDSLMYRFESKEPSNGQWYPDYATMINNLDRNIGRLIDGLGERGFDESTLIIFTTDNGGVFRVTRQYPLRAGKGSYYEGGIRVPLFFVWQGHIEPGRISDIPVTNLDFYPTLLDVIGTEPVAPLDGISLYPILLDNSTVEARDLFWHFPVYLQSGNEETADLLFRTRPGTVTRSGKWKLHQYFEDGRLELYNLETDPGEQNNLAESEPDITQELLDRMEKWRQETGAPVPDQPNPKYNPAAI